ncbi:MAG: IPT/TIG domain-containing protein [Thermomicrobiales bacterium]
MPVPYLTRTDIPTAPSPWNTVTDRNAIGGSYLSTTTGGATLRIDVPVGTTSVSLLATARPDGGVCTYAVDGGPPVMWNQFNGATQSTESGYYWYRTMSPPIAVNPYAPHTIVVSAAAGGTVTTLDAVEFWQAQPVVPKTIAWFGHSIVYGFLINQCPNSSPTIPIPTRFSTLISTQINMTEINQSVPGEDLTLGNTGFGTNTFSPLPGWQRAEAGADFAGTTWASDGIYCDAFPAPYSTAGAMPQKTWWAVRPQIAVVMHARNDVGMDTTYDGIKSVRSRPNPNHFVGDKPLAAPPPAGAGYALKRYTQRLRELVWRMNCASPNTLIVLCGICYDTTLATSYANDRMHYDNATAMVAREQTSSNTIFVDTWTGTAQGGASLLQSDGTHPTVAGHQALADIIHTAIAAPAVVTAISDAGGLTLGHNSVKIIGAGFFPGATVSFGDRNATSVTLLNSTTLQVMPPGHESGTVDVTVTNPYQLPGTPSGTLRNAYTYLSPTPTSRIPVPTPTTPPGILAPVPPTRPGVTPTPGTSTPDPLPPRRSGT